VEEEEELEAEDEEKSAPFTELITDILDDRWLYPTSAQFIHYSNLGTLGRTEKGGILVKDDDGIFVVEIEPECGSEADEIIRQLGIQLRSEKRTVRKAENFWKKELREANQGGLAFQVNTMYKRKDQKVQPVTDSTAKTAQVEGRKDWKARAAARQIPNPDQSWRKFQKHFEPRYAPFPVGQRLTTERWEALKIGPELWATEKEMLKEILLCREGALSWDFSESGRVHTEVVPPIKINTIPHEAWKENSFPIPRMLRDQVSDMIKQRIARGALEYSRSPYRNPWFLVKKKDAGYRLINNAQRINAVTVRDANLPPNPDEFSEEFAGCRIMSLIDWFSGYDQVELHIDSRPLTAFSTPEGLVQQCTLPMGTTNSVAEFVRVVMKILHDQIPDRCMPYMDDIGVKGPKTDYNQEEIEPGIRRFVAEHIHNLDCVLADMERAGSTASGFKTDWCFDSMVIVGYLVDRDGRHPDEKKVRKINGWPPCMSPKEVRMFIGVCVYYRIWIEDFARKAEPLFTLLKKNITFTWLPSHDQAMASLKKSITSAPALVTMDYSEPIRRIVINVDGSMKGWGAVLQQLGRDDKRHPVRFESGVWSQSERNWDSGKHECKGLLLALKKFRPWIYGVHFTVETDARTLINQLNRSATDLPGALITRWLALLNMWEFDIKHVEGKRNVVADALSRIPEAPGWEPPLEPEEDIEEFVDRQLNTISIQSLQLIRNPDETQPPRIKYTCRPIEEERNVLDSLHTEEFREIATWLTTLKRPERVSNKEMKRIRKTARHYRVVEGYLWRKASGDRPLRRVVDLEAEQYRIIHELHDESGHRGKEGTWRKICHRYHWPNMYRQVAAYIRTCQQCQFHTNRRFEEELHPTEPIAVAWSWVTLDVVYMPNGRQGQHYMVVARCCTTGWVEAKAISKNDSKTIVKFLEDFVFSRWGVPYKISVDGGPENKGLVIDLAHLFGFDRVVASSYHPQGQGMIERGHKELVGALRKMSGNWVDNLSRALWADRVTVKRSTGETPAYLLCGQEHVLPIELCIPTWQTLPWEGVQDTESLIALRAEQFEQRGLRLQEAVDRIHRLRQEGKEWFDEKANLRVEPLDVGDLVLVRDTFNDQDMSRITKLDPKWKGPYRIKRISNKGWFQLEELDGVPFRNTTPGNRVVRFYQREAIRLPGEDQQGDDSDTQSEADSERPHEEETLPDNPSNENGRPPVEPTHPLFTARRSRRLNPNYGQDLPGRRPRVEVRIPARSNADINLEDFEIYNRRGQDLD
jgi:hypothetical protein